MFGGTVRSFIVAECGANHLGSLERALAIIDVAKKSGADACKIQLWSPESMCVTPCQIESGPWKGRNLSELYRECEIPWHWLPTLFAYAKSIDIELFGSAFDAPSIAELERFQVKRHKIASCELVDLGLIRAASSTGKPLILSTGMATHAEIDAAVQAADSDQVTLLRCVSGYPASPEEIGLTAMQRMSVDWWTCRVGLSDHTMGTAISVAAVALGATMIEKHLTLSRRDGGPDAGFSMEPDEFARLVSDCRMTADAMTEIDYGPTPSEKSQLPLRRSLFWSQDLEEGSVVKPDSTITARPSTGLKPALLSTILGKRLAHPVKAHSPVLESDLNA